MHKFFKILNKQTFLSLLSIFLLVVLDQFSKMWAESYLKEGPDIVLIKGVLELHYLENTGVAFSMFKGATGVFIALTIIICLLLFAFFVQIPYKRHYMPLRIITIFLIAGAFGNLIDRMSNKYVIDFIYFSLINFPVFNIADIYVTCSIFVLILLILFYYKDEDFDFLKLKNNG